MTPKDQIFLSKILGTILGIFMFIMFCYYAATPDYLWDEAILMAADKTFWFGLIVALSGKAVIEFIQRHHNKRG